MTYHLYPPGRPDSVNVVVHVVELLNDMDCVEPAANDPEEGEGLYVVVQPALSLEIVVTV